MVISLDRRLYIKITFALYFIHFVLSYIGGEWYYSNEKWGMTPIYTSLVNNIRLLYLLMLLAIGIYEMIIQMKSNRVCFLDQILFIFFFGLAIYKLYETSEVVDLQTLLFQSGTPMMYLMLLSFFIGMDDDLKDTLQAMTKTYAFLFLALTLIYFGLFCLNVGYTFGDRFQSSSIMYSFNNGLFLLIYALYQEDNFERSKIWRILLPLLVLDAFITTGRGWMLQAMFAVLIYFLLQKRGERIILNIFRGFIAIVAIFLVIRAFSPNVVNTLLARIGQTTRSGQLETFFDQVSVNDLVSGLGYGASYAFSGWSDFQYIDNQIIFSAFRYGILLTILLLYFLVKPIILSIGIDRMTMLRSMGIGQFILALLGLSIYFTLSMDICNIAAYMLAGRIYADAKNARLFYDSEEMLE